MNWRALGEVLERIELAWAGAGWAATFLIIAGLTLRWRILLSQQGIALPLRTVFSLTWGGQFFNSILPGSTGGDVMKLYQICRIAPDRKAAGVATVFVDRFLALLALLVLAAVGFLLEPLDLGALTGIANDWSGSQLIGLLALVVLAVLIFSWLTARLLRGSRWLDRLRQLWAAARTNFTFGPSLLAVLALAFTLHFLNFLVAYLYARSLGIGVTLAQVSLFMPVVLFLVLLPVTINGHGLREILLIIYFTQMGVNLSGASVAGVREIAVALSLLLISNDLLWSLPGGLWYFATFGKMRPK